MRTILSLLFIIASMGSCHIDNYAEPHLTLTGKIIDSLTGELVPSSGANAGELIKLFESNSTQPLLYNALPDGSFENSRVFPATYRIVAEGAFTMAEDTLSEKITNDMQIDIKVVPFVRLKMTTLSFVDSTAKLQVTYEKVNAQQEMIKLGVVWSTYGYPSATVFPDGNIILDDVSALGLTTGQMTYTVAHLDPKGHYYLRALAQTNNAGAYYNYSTQLELQLK